MKIKRFNYKNTFFIYTCAFLLLLPAVFLPFILQGRSLVWRLDGLDQHLPLLKYYGKLLRSLLSGHGFAMVDFKLGLGYDTITTMSYYVLGDPITLLTVFMTPKNSVPFYDFLIALRFYLAGISFILLMKYWKKDGFGTVLGALIYVFSGYSLYACIRHPFFMNPMIYLPLLIIGTELVLRRKKPYLMVIMVFVSAISNFYFFFDLTVIIVVYILFRYFTLYRKSYKNIFSGLFFTGLRTGGYYLLGVALSSFLLLPIIYAFTQNGRLNAKPQLLTGLLCYENDYYLKFFQGMFAGGVYPKYWTVLSFSCVIAVTFAIIITNKKYLKLRLAYVLTFLGLFIPAFGYFMNGGSYITNRWCFALSLLVAATFSMSYERFFDLGKKEKIALIVEIVIYGLLAFLFPSKLIVSYVFFFLIFILLVLLVFSMNWFKDKKEVQGAVIFALVFLTICVNGNVIYSPRYNNYAHQFLSERQVNKLSEQGVLSLIPDISDSSFYRIDTYGNSALNEALTVGYHGISGYYSLMDGSNTAYLKDLEDLNQISAYRFQNMDNRTILNTLANVKYFVSTDLTAAPYGYKLIKEKTVGHQSYYLFQNEYALPLGYTYNQYMLKEDYDGLSALQKQNAMLSSVILDQDTDYAVKSKQDNNTGIEKLQVKIIPDENVTLSNHKIAVKKAGAKIALEFNAKPNSEVYIRLDNLKINQRRMITTKFLAWAGFRAKKCVYLKNKYYNSYFGKENYLINTGSSAYANAGGVLTFPKRQIYSYNSIDVYGVDMNYYKSQVALLSKNTLSNIKKTNNRIQGDITMDKKGIMALGIPFSKGWSAYVDGTKKELLKGNVMYMALPLEAGSHHVALKYETPYLKEGFMISLAAFAILFGISPNYRRKEKM